MWILWDGYIREGRYRDIHTMGSLCGGGRQDTVEPCGWIGFKNAGMTILHRIVGQEDLKMILNVVSLGEKQINYIKEMEIGEAVVKDRRHPHPIHIKVSPYLP